MIYDFTTYQMSVDNHTFWVAESKSLKGCIGQGDTVEEAISELSVNETEWIDSAKKYGIKIPNHKPRQEYSYSGKFSLRMSPFLHEDSSNHAESLGISLNQYINDALGYYNNIVDTKYSDRNSFSTSNTTTDSFSAQKKYDSNIISMPKRIKQTIGQEEM